MNSIIEPLAWDSRFLGFPVGRLISLNMPEQQLRSTICGAWQEGWRLLYWAVDPDDKTSNQSAQVVGAVLADQKVRFVLDVELTAQPLPPAIQAATTLTPALHELAQQSGMHSRFRLDPHFAPGVYERLYREWIEKSIQGERARIVLQYQPTPTANATGLLTLGVRPGRADIGLLAVDAGMRRQGIGHQLIQGAKHYAAAWYLPQLQVVTQRANTSAYQFYESEGFRLEHEELIYHLWL
ncbi:GNAT family N-acetyltransferase [Hymenobacter taeanensis]|uniref:GNAT family N-acetyltransferase n=1 Tax=Hymenobacter taeanensis TaxID=2735321 RepID=A0A6M6BCS0_9BACT|nr:MULTISPECIES: GNAT family N-acetyltransferase [Hymenobacter]QJX45986.1 GNAT family N-acetyltransferase [Hymenobacter taeanensis]UOQ79837.1 GNAT family N-acetyltransferase [Hymenobacter sp. 5414T-23]